MVSFGELVAAIRRPPLNSWFLTVTISPKLNKLHPKIQFLKAFYPMVDILDRFCGDYCIVTELSGDGNVHFHAWFTYRNPNHRVRLICTFKEKKYNSILGFVKINGTPITEIDRVYDYMCGTSTTEDKDKTGKDLKEACVIVNDINLVYNYTPLLTRMCKTSDVSPSSVMYGVSECDPVLMEVYNRN